GPAPHCVHQTRPTGPVDPSTGSQMTTEPMKDAAEQAAAENAEPGARQDDAIAALEQELEDARADAARQREDSLRERADLENQRRRMARELDNARRFANERLLGELLPVVDSLEAALQAEGGADAVREGVELTLKMLLKVAADHGLAEVDPVDGTFDPEHHQAMSTTSDAARPAGQVVQVYQKGWVLNGRLLRPALVVVNKHD